jgi:ketosteroid isomerase-like protein
MSVVLALALVAWSFQGAGVAPEKSAVLARIHRFTDAFNKGDTKTAAEACTAEAAILDEFPPYAWHGTGTCLQWMNDYDADARKNGVTGGHVTLGDPRHVEITGGRAYVVMPAEYTFQQKGRPMKESGATLVIALTKSAGDWKITSWAWSKP